MRSSHQLVAIGISVFVALGQVAPAVSQPQQNHVSSSDSEEPTAATQPQTTESAKTAAPTKAVESPQLAGATQSTEAAKPLALPSTAESPNPAKAANPTESAKLDAAPIAPAVATDRSPSSAIAPPPKPAKAAKFAPSWSRKAAKAASKPLQTVGATNVADFKKAQNEASPSAPPAMPATMPGMAPATDPDTPVMPSIQPFGPAKAGAAPDYLNADPNPLTIPTRPEDAKVRGIQPITLKQALELAKRNNRDYQIAALTVQRSHAALRQAQAALYPTVTTQANLAQSQSAAGELQQRTAEAARANVPRAFRNAGNADRASLLLNGTVEVAYNIYTGGQRPAQIRAAEQQLRSDQLQLEVTENQMRLDVTTAYYNLQEADEAVRIQQSAVRNAEASLRDTQALERAGLGTRFDVLRAQVQLANSQQSLTNSLAAQRTRRRELAQVLAVPVYIDLAAADKVEMAGSWTIDLPQTIVLALKNRAELEQQLAAREQAEQRRRAALGALRPNVALQVQYNVLDNLRDQIGFVDGYSVAAAMSWNIFDGGSARAQANQQEANKAIAETRFAQTRENIQLQVETAFYNMQSTFLNIGTNRQAVAQAREALRLARLRFQAGVGTQTDVINAENDLTRAEGNLVTAVIGYNRSLASLERAVTNLPIATGSTTPSIPGPAPALPPETTN